MSIAAALRRLQQLENPTTETAARPVDKLKIVWNLQKMSWYQSQGQQQQPFPRNPISLKSSMIDVKLLKWKKRPRINKNW
jgi:hypothetical protein